VNSEKLNNWLQLVGMAGVIGSLIFVGMQLRQTQEIAMSDAYQTRAYGSVGMNAASNSSPTLLSAEAKLWVGKQDELKPEEIVALVHDFYGRMETFENNHYQYTAGFLGEEHWQKNLLQLHCLFSHSIYQELWDANEFRSSFAALVDRILQDVRNNPSDCWEYEHGSIWDWD